ncbi:MAG: hypothetical protein ACRDIC_19525 [bacterium]
MLDAHGHELIGKWIWTEPMGDWKGGNAQVVELGDDPFAPEIVFQVRNEAGDEIGVFEFEEVAFVEHAVPVEQVDYFLERAVAHPRSEVVPAVDRILIAAPPMMAYLLDVAFTAYGWSRGGSEASPLARWILVEYRPAGFIALAVAYGYLVMFPLLLLVSEQASRFLGLVVFTGHSVGLCSWISWFLAGSPFEYYAWLLVVVFLSVVGHLCWMPARVPFDRKGL